MSEMDFKLPTTRKILGAFPDRRAILINVFRPRRGSQFEDDPLLALGHLQKAQLPVITAGQLSLSRRAEAWRCEWHS